MAVSTYKHGVTWKDVPTSIVAPITADTIPVAFGTAPSFMSTSPAPADTPRIYKSFNEFVAEMGYSEDFESWTLCEVAYTFFALHNSGPIVCVNVFDAEESGATGAPTTTSPNVTNGECLLDEQGVILSSIVVKDDPAGTITYLKDTDYTAGYRQDGTVAIHVIPGGAIPPAATKLKVTRAKALPDSIDETDIIGGVDSGTGKATGLEAIEDVFTLHTVVPGIIIAPGFSHIPEVAAVMTSKCENINGCFRCVCYADIDPGAADIPSEVNAWKNSNNYVSNRLAACWPRVAIDETETWLSTQLAALSQTVDHKNGEVPMESPSNKHLKMNKTIVKLPGSSSDIMFSKANADMLNGQGVVTAINWIGGWKAWGNNMTIYPSESDPKDRWIPVRRMTDWLGNSIVLTVFQFVDRPGNRRLIDSIVDSLNMWLNSLVHAGQLLGARVEFRHDENPDTELLAGHYVFHVYEAVPVPAEWIEFLIEFDVTYLSTLFTSTTAQTPVT
jgi:uncharacterized protein